MKVDQRKALPEHFAKPDDPRTRRSRHDLMEFVADGDLRRNNLLVRELFGDHCFANILGYSTHAEPIGLT